MPFQERIETLGVRGGDIAPAGLTALMIHPEMVICSICDTPFRVV